MARRIPELVGNQPSLWLRTAGVYNALAEIAAQRDWDIFPKEASYKGEYLCDFMLVEYGYGVRVACESQWEQRVGDHQQRLDWAFEKLRGVKATVKLFVFDGTEEQSMRVQDQYLYSYAQLSTDETFVLLRREAGVFNATVWTPERNGVQASGTILFRDL